MDQPAQTRPSRDIPATQLIHRAHGEQEQRATARGTHLNCEPWARQGSGRPTTGKAERAEADWRTGCGRFWRGICTRPVASPSASGTRGVEAGAHQRHDAPVTRIKTRLKRPETPAGSRTPRCTTREQVRRNREREALFGLCVVLLAHISREKNL
ncbi:hypothetical protein PVAP13_4KG062966 [Panicum virgatum]|uniref:Uncharacterized protein n=1 Tax=Panicum virgatum TaxID=38727 RepID=A0A8T0TLL1_PANVG|nr:hypothetical protein PVAP13_4KG062966 [Panicum virgatum]